MRHSWSLSFVIVLVADVLGAQSDLREDGFDRLVAINKASLVGLAEAGILEAPLAKRIADAVAVVAAEESKKGTERSSNYLEFEPRLIAHAGREASRIHSGRSRQDIGSTSRRMALRASLLRTYAAQAKPRRALLALAAKHVRTVVPAYTHGVQAQPTTLGQILLAFAAALERDAERLRQAYRRVNRCPLGAAALGTSGFPIDRWRLAALLGFDKPVENAFDANFISSVDSKIEVANALATSAVHVGQFVQNVHTQYHDPRPWIRLADKKTSGSSIMPQKRNPRPLDRLRTSATRVIGRTVMVLLHAHNTNSGMHDYRDAREVLATLKQARDSSPPCWSGSTGRRREFAGP